MAGSFAFRAPVALVAGVRAATSVPVAALATPGIAAWTAWNAAAGLVEAFRVGARVRRAPVLRARPDVLAAVDEIVPVCSLVSDTHVCEPARVPCELELYPQMWPRADAPRGREIAEALARVLLDIRARAPHTVVWCGDEVDSGAPAEWRTWREVTGGVPGLAHRLVPGNHDIVFNRPFEEDHVLARRALREHAFRAHGGRLGDFPLFDTIITDDGPATLVLLDSCRHRSTHVLSNAIAATRPMTAGSRRRAPSGSARGAAACGAGAGRRCRPRAR